MTPDVIALHKYSGNKVSNDEKKYKRRDRKNGKKSKWISTNDNARIQYANC